MTPTAPTPLPHGSPTDFGNPQTFTDSIAVLLPGRTYLSRDLYGYYADLSRHREQRPMTAHRYGRQLRAAGLLPGRDHSGNRRTWTVPAS